jgi:hypothetical protein
MMESVQNTVNSLDPLSKVLTRTPEKDEEAGGSAKMMPREGRKHGKLSELHPYAQTLTLEDVASCVALENAAFVEPDQRCSQEKAGPFLFDYCY